MPVMQILTEQRVPIKIWTNGIDQVMENQSDLVEVLHTLKQVVCIKG